jgi:hypothetical protein
MTGNCDIAACLSQCLLTQFNQQSFPYNKTKRLKYSVLTLVLSELFSMNLESEAHETVSLLFHRDEVPNVTVMYGPNAKTEGQIRSKLHHAGCHIKKMNPTHNPPTWVKGECVSA